MTSQGFDDSEWQAQERAGQAVRHGAAPVSDDGADAAYRRIVQALREPPSIDLPRDFAAHVAKLVSPSIPTRDAKVDPELRIAGEFLASPLGVWSFSALCCAAATQGFQFLITRMARGFEASLR